MNIHLVTGGVRSGKSRYAEACATELGGDSVTYVATGLAVDDEMRERFREHQLRRPRSWTTREAPDDADSAVRDASTAVVLLECLTFLLANALGSVTNEREVMERMNAKTGALLTAAASREGDLIVVTNEVGWGIHPETALGRWYRDGMGRANQRVAEEAHSVTLLVSGIAVPIKGSLL